MGAVGLKMYGLMCLFLCVHVMGQGGPPAAEEPVYIIVFTSPIYRCPDEKSIAFVDPSGVEATRVDENTSCMRGSLVMLDKFNNDSMMEIVLEKETQGKMDKVMTHELCNVCKEFGNEDGEYYKFIQFFGLPESCPFEPGSYPIHDMMVDTSDLAINGANVGCYLATLNFKRSPDGSCKDEMEFLGCLKLEFCIEPI